MTGELVAREAFTAFFRDYLRRGLHVDATTTQLPITYLRELYAPALTFNAIANPLLAYLSAVDITPPTRWALPMRQCRLLHESLMPDEVTQDANTAYLFFADNYVNAFEGVNQAQERYTFHDRFIAASQRQTPLDEWSELAVGISILDHVLHGTLQANLDDPIPAVHQEWLDRLGRLMQLIRENFGE